MDSRPPLPDDEHVTDDPTADEPERLDETYERVDPDDFPEA